MAEAPGGHEDDRLVDTAADDVERAAAELNDIFRVEHFKPAERMHLVKD